MHTPEEIEHFVKYDLVDLGLTDREIEQYIKLIGKMDRYIERNKYRFGNNVFEYFQDKYQNIYSRFIEEGYNTEESLELAKKAALYSDRKDFITNLNFSRCINFELEVLKQNIYLCFRKNVEVAHAKKAYLVEIGDTKHQTITHIIRSTDKQFENKFGVNMGKLKKKYPVTDELKEVWAYQAKLTDEKLLKEFNLTREQMAAIYPTTKEELEILKRIAKLTNQETLTKYGITKKQLLEKHPLNKDTLLALSTVCKSSNSVMEKVMGMPKTDILRLRTITTEMIKLAANENNIKLVSTKTEKPIQKLYKQTRV